MATLCSSNSTFLGNKNVEYRIGFSKDIHQLDLDRKFVLGGVIIPYTLGEKAHSDGDVVYHAIAEAILGALALGDLGKHFPDTDPTTEGMDSTIIMKYVVGKMKNMGYRVQNVDVTIVLESPKLAPFISKMCFNITNLLGIDYDKVSVKAGTNEGMGEVGANRAVEAYCSILLRKDL